jgi:hypothetical protein
MLKLELTLCILLDQSAHTKPPNTFMLLSHWKKVKKLLDYKPTGRSGLERPQEKTNNSVLRSLETGQYAYTVASKKKYKEILTFQR